MRKFLAGIILLSCCSPVMASADVYLYVLNCGTINVSDFYNFSDTGFYPHAPRTIADPCFLIKHNHSWMLWDLGVGDQYAGKGNVAISQYGVTVNVPVSLLTQLREIGLTSKDIQYVGLSHVHFDHTGNVNLFPNATFLMQQVEYQSLQNKPLPPATESDLYALLKKAHKKLLNGDYDVFGDGTVIILSTPGHTIGHQSLELKLAKSGVIILSGDLYHTHAAYEHQLVPCFNYSRSETLTSMDKVNAILVKTNGRLVIQHDLNDFNTLPKFPQFLQ